MPAATEYPRPASPPSVAAAAAAMIMAVLKAVFKTVFVLDARQALTRSAIFLLAFLVVHLAGNLLFFAGQDAFNRYAQFLESLPIIKIIEGYLALCFGIHTVVAVYQTVKKKAFRGATSEPLSVLRRLYLLVSGTVILVFVVLHLQHFKFGERIDYVPPATAAAEEPMEDFYTLELRLFADPYMAGWYAFAMLTLAVHLYQGWTKAVQKMDLDKPLREPVRRLGHWLIVPLTIGFLACIAGGFFKARE